MKRLHIFIVKSFVGPFAITFCISLFLLVMQFFWKYIDDLMGKGLDSIIILELLFWVTLNIVPMALPLAVLISSIMTLGNLAENNELTALKASGLSLYRILSPLFVVMIMLGIGTFFFSNYILPVSNLKWRWIVYDIQQQKPTLMLDEGRFYNDLDGYAIKANEIDKEESILKDIIIYDHTIPKNLKVIRAEYGEMRTDEEDMYLYLKLFNGRLYESVTPTNSTNSKHLPFRKSKFKDVTIRFDLSGFSTNRSNEEIFKNNVEMLNIFQLENAIDSVEKLNIEIKNNFAKNIKDQHGYFLSETYIHGESPSVRDDRIKKNQNNASVYDKRNSPTNTVVMDSAYQRKMDENKKLVDKQNKARTSVLVSESILNPNSWSKSDLNNSIQTSTVKLGNRKDELAQYIQIIEGRDRNLDKYEMEWHRKFTLSISIIVLFFIGAPLGAIIRKGGLGMPVVVSVFLFIVYYVLMIVGEKMIKSQIFNPDIGMWLSTFVLAPMGIFLMYKAANDSKIFNKESFSKLFGFKRLFKRLNLRKKTKP